LRPKCELATAESVGAVPSSTSAVPAKSVTLVMLCTTPVAIDVTVRALVTKVAAGAREYSTPMLMPASAL